MASIIQGPPWTDAQKACVTELWSNGLSASAVARALHDQGLRTCTRNSVIGIINRMGLPGRAQPTRKFKKTTRKPRSTARYVPTAGGYVYPTGDAQPKPLPRPAHELWPLCGSVLDLNAHECRWPVGDPKTQGGFGFCARVAPDGHSYCEHHAAVARRPVEERKRRHVHDRSKLSAAEYAL